MDIIFERINVFLKKNQAFFSEKGFMFWGCGIKQH